MYLKTKLGLITGTIGAIIGVAAIFNTESDTTRIPAHCTNYQPNGALTAIRFGAEPVDTHLWGRNTVVDNLIEDNFRINAGVTGATNILFVEFGSRNDEGKFMPERRIYAFERNMQPYGEIIAGAYGSESLPFSHDPMYDDDPDREICGKLQSTNGGYFSPNLWPGDTIIAFEGTPEQVNEIYAESLQYTYQFNEQKHKFDMLGNKDPNGNSFFAKLSQVIETRTQEYGQSIPVFNPRGIDLGLNWSGDVSTTKIELPSDPKVLEQMVANQIISYSTSSPQNLPSAAPHQ